MCENIIVPYKGYYICLTSCCITKVLQTILTYVSNKVLSFVTLCYLFLYSLFSA